MFILQPQPSRVGREAFRQAILQRLIPALRAFSPDLILLSTGFDMAEGDVGNLKSSSSPLSPGVSPVGMDLKPADFEWVTMELVKIADICCNGRLVRIYECYSVVRIFSYSSLFFCRR